MRTRRGVATALCAALAVACSGEVNSLPVGAKVTCSTDADCPSGFFCSQVLDRCIQRGGADQTPPTLVSHSVVPGLVRAGATVTATFEVSEDLSSDPFVHLSGATEPLGLPSRAGRTFTIEFAPTSSLGTQALSVVADLVDLYGNEAANQPVGTFQLDLAQPSVSNAIFPAFAKKGDVYTASLTFDEDLGDAPALRIAGGPALAAAQNGSARQWRFTRTLDGSEPAGLVDLALDASDVAGNALATTFTGASTLDFVAPTVAATSVATPAVRTGNTVLATVQFSEALGVDAPVVTLVPSGGGPALPVAVGAIDPRTYSLSYAVPANAADASHTLTLVSAKDRAGNDAAGQALGQVAIDSKPPAVTAISVDHTNRLYKAGDGVTVTFTLGEPPAADPVVKLAAGASTLSFGCTHAALAYTCASSGAVPAAFPEGGAIVAITVADVAGNVATDAAPIVLDFTPPGLASPPATRYLGSSATRNVNVQAVGTGSSWEIALLTDEPLGAAPTVTAVAPGGAPTRALTLTQANAALTSFTFTLPASPTAYPAAAWSVEWNPVDAARNQRAAPIRITTVEVDGTPPPAPDPGAAAAPAILWTRKPWGTDAAPTPVFQLDASLASAGTDAIAMVAWDGPGAGAKEVGRHAPSAAQGPFAMQLGSDPAELYVSTLDRAGNESARTRVVDVAWTASLAGKVPGSTFENPHRLESRARFQGSLEQLDGVQLAGADVGVQGDGKSVTTSVASMFRPTAGLDVPPVRIWPAWVADPARRVMVLFGGLGASTSLTDSWEWDGAQWRQVFPSDPEGDGNPSGFIMGGRTYDPVRGGVVVSSNGNGIWLWNGASWRKLLDVGGYDVLVWDEKRGVLVMHHGSDSTYEWDGTTHRAVQVQGAPGAAQRSGGIGFYDTVSQRACMYGGAWSNGTLIRTDVVCWNGSVWSTLATQGTAPPSRTECAGAFDPVRRELFIQGGNGTSGARTDTWVLTADPGGTRTWVDAGAPALAFNQHAAAFDPVSSRVLLLSNRVSNVMRAWDGSAKTYAVVAPGNPEGDGNASYNSQTPSDGDLAWVPDRGVAVRAALDFTRETWEWNRTSWARKAQNTGPSQRFGGAVGGYRNRLVAFGGIDLLGGGAFLGDTWTWDGIQWSQAIASPGSAHASPSPEFRADVGMASDSGTGRLFRWAGYDQVAGVTACFPDLWEWDGTAWLPLGGQVAPYTPKPWLDPEGDGNPSPGNGFGSQQCSAHRRIVWDPSRSTLLALDEDRNVWEWKSATTSWKKHLVGGAISSLFTQFIWDGALQAPVVICQDGSFVVDLANDTAAGFSYANPYGPTPLTEGGVVWDFGAKQGVGLGALPWVWESTASGRPAHVFTVDYSRANGPDPSTCLPGASCPIQSIDVTWNGGGTAGTGDGAHLDAWWGSWLQVATTGGTVASPGLMSWHWPDPAGTPGATLFHGRAHELTLALTPTGATTATGPARVATDAAAVTIRYRRP
ncbi:MAG: hypothetical protein QM704_12325 [Anaeromyxobacteraceae bacterium]